MKFSCIKNDLELGLNITGLFVGKNLDLPVLSCVILESKKNFLNIISTNINTSCEYQINIKSSKEGKVAVNSEIFYKTISNIKDEYIDLEIKENILYIKTDSVNIKINTLDYSDFPSTPKIDQEKNEEKIKIDVSRLDFLNGLSSTVFAASRSNIKPELSSIFINFDLKEINFVATDGFRLSEKIIKQDGEHEKAKILLPLESSEQFIKLLSIINDNSIKITILKNQFFLQGSNFTIFSRLTNGDFVDYKKLIPEDNETSIIFLKDDFINISKLINIFTNDFNQIKITIKNKEVLFSTENKKGNNETKITATVEGNNIDMNFNHKYILDTVPAIKTDSMEFIFNTNKPLIIKPVGDQSFRYIVMPLSK